MSRLKKDKKSKLHTSTTSSVIPAVVQDRLDPPPAEGDITISRPLIRTSGAAQQRTAVHIRGLLATRAAASDAQDVGIEQQETQDEEGMDFAEEGGATGLTVVIGALRAFIGWMFGRNG